MNCNECAKRRCPSFGSSEKCNVCLYTGGDYLEVRDWLADIEAPASAGEAFDCVEVRFKNGRKGFYRNVNRLPLQAGDIVAVESAPGHDVGCVMSTGQLARMQMRRKKEDPASPDIRKVYRVATQKDIDIWQTAISREKKTLVRTREICDNLGLVMKLSDVEFQGDNLKATFYYTAEGRVDFRQLIKELAGAFGVRIEMRQIGLRQEAARVGSIGSCGRELCCTTWLTDFRSVNTSAARTQRLSLNPQKLAGQCGKLKCCLNFELDVYADALKGFPPTDAPLRTEKGVAHFQKMDVFKGMYWYAYDFEAMNWIGLHVADVAEIQRVNRKGEKPESLEMYVHEDDRPEQEGSREETTELKAVEEGEITRFDRNTGRSSRRRGDRRRGEKNAVAGAKDAPAAAQGEAAASANGAGDPSDRPGEAREKNRRERAPRREDRRRENNRAGKPEDASQSSVSARAEASADAPQGEDARTENRRERGGRRRNRGNNRASEGNASGDRAQSAPGEGNPDPARARNDARETENTPRRQEEPQGRAQDGGSRGDQADPRAAGENRSRRGRRDMRRRGNRRNDGRPDGENSAAQDKQ